MNRLLGYKPKEPVAIINNAVDHEIFHNRSRIKWDPSGNRKIRIISSSWCATSVSTTLCFCKPMYY